MTRQQLMTRTQPQTAEPQTAERQTAERQPDQPPMVESRRTASSKSVVTLLGRAALLLFALSLGSCTFLADEFTWLDRAGPIAEPQDQAPSPIVDRG